MLNELAKRQFSTLHIALALLIYSYLQLSDYSAALVVCFVGIALCSVIDVMVKSRENPDQDQDD